MEVEIQYVNSSNIYIFEYCHASVNLDKVDAAYAYSPVLKNKPIFFSKKTFLVILRA